MPTRWSRKISNRRHQKAPAFESQVSLRPSKPPRLERVAEQLRQELSQLMLQEMKDPRVRMASVTEVRVTPDLRNARVMVSAIGSDAERHATVAALRHGAGYLRSQLGDRLENLKVVPHLRFELDESIAYSVHIASVLREMHQDEDAETGASDGEAPQ